MPSLYETTAVVGDVASSDFTTLYNASGLAVPSAGAGAVTGNLNVSGNLTVQGTSLLIGAVTLESTLCLPNYCFPLNDGTNTQVLSTDGAGNLYWANSSSLGVTYSISATSTTGGANLTLTGSDSSVDNVKFASGSNITITRTDADTITISSGASTIPNGTAAGQVLEWNGSAWTADSVVSAASSANILTAEFKNNTTSTASSFAVRRNTGSSAYTTGTDSLALFQFDSNSQAVASVGAMGFAYSATNPVFGITTSTNNFSTNTFITKIDSTDVKFNGTNLVLNFNHSGVPTQNATITVERGSSTDATLTWDEATDLWTFSDSLSVLGGYLYLSSGKYLNWNSGDSRFEFSDQLFISQPTVAFKAERQTTQAASLSNEVPSALELIERVTDAPSNATDNGGPGITFARISGASGGTQATYGSLGARYYGTTNTAEFAFNWSNDNFSEPTPGNFPATYTLFRAGSNDSSFLNDSLLINYSAQGTTRTATSITGGNTLVFSSAHGLSVGQRIQFTSTTQNGLTQNAYYYVVAAGFTTTQCRIGLTSTGTAIALTNGTGLTLNFVNLINRVGINTATPGYTLDVNGDINASGSISTGGITAGNITVGVVNDNTISTTSGDLDIYPVSGSDMTLSTTAATNPVTLARTSANTNTPTRAAKLQLATSGTPAVGIGTRLEFSTQTAASTFKAGAYIETESTNIGTGTEAFDMNFWLMNGGTSASKATLTSVGNFSIAGDLTVNGNDIKSSTATALTLSGADVAVAGDLTVTGNDIKSSTATALTLSGADVAVAGDLTVTGNDIKSSGGTTAITMNGADVAIAGNLGVDIAATNVTVQIGSEVSMITAQVITTSIATVALTTSTRSSMNGSVTIKDNVTNDLHTVNFTVLRNGATALLTTYGELYTSAALANFTADVSGSVIRLLATPVSANNTTFNAVRTAIS